MCDLFFVEAEVVGGCVICFSSRGPRDTSVVCFSSKNRRARNLFFVEGSAGHAISFSSKGA